MLEKRNMQRRHLIYYLKVIDSKTEEPIGFLVDITTRGILIMSEDKIETGKEFHLKMLLQTEMSDQKYLNFNARSKWCDKSVNADFFDTGFELLNVSPEDFKGIEGIIEDLGFKE